MQLADLASVLFLAAGAIFYRAGLGKKIASSANVYPNAGIYSLAITNLPSSCTSAQLTAKYHNKENIIQVAVVKNYKGLVQELDRLYEADRLLKKEVRRAQEANLPAGNSEKLSAKVDACAQPVLVKLRQNLTQASFPTTLGFLTFATIKSKHRFLERYRDTLHMDDLFLCEGVRIEICPAEDPKNYLVANWDQSTLVPKLLLWLALFGVVIMSAALMLALPFLKLGTSEAGQYILVLLPALCIAGGNFLLRWLTIVLAARVPLPMLVGTAYPERGRGLEAQCCILLHCCQHSPNSVLRGQYARDRTLLRVPIRYSKE